MISERAAVSDKAKIGKNVTIEPFAFIADDVIIGDGAWVGPNSTILDGARIGKNCKIFPGAVISAIPQDLKFNGEVTQTEIGDNTIIRECVTVNRGTDDKGKTVVGSGCLLMAYVHVGHDTIVGNHCVLANAVTIAGHVVIEDYAILEGLVAIQQFVKIGAHTFIAGGSKVRKNVPPYVKAAREPLSFIGVNTIGLKRRGFEDTVIQHIEDIYRNIYVFNKNIGSAIKIVDAEMSQTPERDRILEFIRNSENGIMRGPA
ncbi:MAG: UDP-N-acetylglucosamine acyltransferase [Patiriisocius sp.]|jgi:UDP-N-acetylglucosamine acyltransferase